MAQHTPYCRTDRWIIVCNVMAVILLVSSYFHPLWFVQMSAPQYPERDLVVSVYPGWMQGDLAEVSKLNQYIGVTIPKELPELTALPWVFGAAGFLLLVTLWTHPGKLRRYLLGAASTLLLGVTLLGLALVQYRLYVIGHDRAANPPMVGIPDFTPPVLGSVEIANFEVFMMIDLGGWFVGIAMGLALTSTFIEWFYHRSIDGEIVEQEPSVRGAS